MVQLSLQAQQNAGVKTALAQRRTVTTTISTTGWLSVKPGHEVEIKAAATGFIVPAGEDTSTEIGRTVCDRQELGKLQFFLSPQEEAQLIAVKEETDTVIGQSLASLAIAQERYESVKVLEGGAVAQKELQLLQEIIQRSQAAIEEARDKLPFLPSEPYERPLRLDDMAITSPLAGQITEVYVRPRQFVVQGDSLWAVADWSTLWIKFPVFEGDLPQIDQTLPIEVRVPGSDALFSARATGIALPTGDGRRTMDLCYEIDNANSQLRPGQAVSAALPTDASSDLICVPHSALLWDGMGGAWVYVRDDADTFRRQKVQVGASHAGMIAIERGLDERHEVIVVGAEVIFGEEFKSQVAVEDDD